MTLLPVVRLPNKMLSLPAKDVPGEEIQSAEMRRLIADMKETLAASPDGVGLAAPQVGESLKIFLVSEEANLIGSDGSLPEGHGTAKKKWRHFVFINPEMIKKSRGKIKMAEGCLSLPDKFGLVERREKISLSWLDESGKKQSRGFTGFFARVIQHEMDHLDGKLIADRAKKLFGVLDGK